MATEEPKFDLIKKTQNYEIRNYSDRPSIQTIKNSGEDTALGVCLNIFQVQTQYHLKLI